MGPLDPWPLRYWVPRNPKGGVQGPRGAHGVLFVPTPDRGHPYTNVDSNKLEIHRVRILPIISVIDSGIIAMIMIIIDMIQI